MKKIKSISEIYKNKLIKLTVFLFCITFSITCAIQIFFESRALYSRLRLYVEDVKNTIVDNYNWYFDEIGNDINKALKKLQEPSVENMKMVAEAFDMTELSIIGTDGIIRSCSNEDLIGKSVFEYKDITGFSDLLKKRSKQDVIADIKNSMTSEDFYSFGVPGLFEDEIFQLSFDSEYIRILSMNILDEITSNNHIGIAGGITVWNLDNEIMSTTTEHAEEIVDFSFFNVAQEDHLFIYDVYGQKSFCFLDRIAPYTILAFYPVKEAIFDLVLSISLFCVMELILFLFLLFLVLKLNDNLVVKNLNKVNVSLTQIANGNLDVFVDVRTNKEFILLSDDINNTVATLKSYIEKESKRIEQDLKFANIVQTSALPRIYPPYSDNSQFDIFASMIPAKVVGGDFYDFYLLDKTTLAIEIADVSDKGFAAAMFMMSVKTLIKTYVESGLSPAKALELANDRICQNNDATMFLTVWLGILDLTTGNLVYANAGHNQPLIKTGNEDFKYFTTETDFIVGALPKTTYTEYSMKLNFGDILYLYTDGITEANSADGEFYGELRLNNFLNETIKEASDLKVLCERVKSDVDNFSKGIAQSDDMTMVCLRYNVSD